MFHNESVNVWSHLGGAIILTIICVFLAFSVSHIDTHNIQEFVQHEVKELFEPIHAKLPNFTQLEYFLS